LATIFPVTKAVIKAFPVTRSILGEEILRHTPDCRPRPSTIANPSPANASGEQTEVNIFEIGAFPRNSRYYAPVADIRWQGRILARDPAKDNYITAVVPSPARISLPSRLMSRQVGGQENRIITCQGKDR